jgi:hypothetical protein
LIVPHATVTLFTTCVPSNLLCVTDVLLVHAAATLMMVGVIWIVQVVHYPLFARVAGDFRPYADEHSRRITWVVAPPMLIEAGTGLLLVIDRPNGIAPVLAWTGLALIAVLWLSTMALQVPEHQRLGRGFDPGAHRRLVLGNWVRTAAWSARGAIVLVMLSQTI